MDAVSRAHGEDLCPGGPAIDGSPVGSLRRRAPVQAPAIIVGAPVSIRQVRRVDLELAWFVGIDWGSQKHQACVLDAGGRVLGERAFEHGGAGLTQMADWLLGVRERRGRDRCGDRNATGAGRREPDGARLRRPLDQPQAARPRLSLAYNRGAFNSELGTLRVPLALAEQQWSTVAGLVGAMQQNHELSGIALRRQYEANLIRAELEYLNS